MRILIFNWRDLSHPLAGGAEVFTDAVAREWVVQGHQVTLFSSAVAGLPGLEISGAGYEIVRRGSKHSVYRQARNFWRKEGQGNFDLVIDEVNTRPFMCPRFIRDVPVVGLIYQVAKEVWFHETPWPLALLGRYILEPLWLRPYRDVPVITISESSRESLERFGLRHIRVVPVGFEPRKVQINRPPKEATPTVIFVGRLARNKRPDHAIRAYEIACHRMPSLEMWIVGTGPMASRLKEGAPAGVRFLGRVDEDEKVELLSRAHVLIATSVREGWGLVVTEAAAVGTPSIAYNVPGLRDSVTASGGVIVACSPQALGNELVERLSLWTADKPPRMSMNGSTSWSDVSEQILEVADCPWERS